MREKEYSEWMGKQGFDALRHANCCKIAFNGGWESRQTEVDELKKLRGLDEMAINHLSQANQAWKLKVDELNQELELVLNNWNGLTMG